MAEIVPAIIAKDFEDYKSKVDLLRGETSWFHLDVVDGKFAPNVTWGDAEKISAHDPDAFLSVHLMVDAPESQILGWAKSAARKIFFHHESTASHDEIIRICKENETDVGIALRPETSIDAVSPWSEEIDSVLVLAVDPGFYGSGFKEEAIQKVRDLRKLYPDLEIVLDGGMNVERAKSAVLAGANTIVSGSFIFNSEDPKKALRDLKNVVTFQ